MKPLFQCDTCHHDFNSLGLFDKHRVGKHEYTFVEGFKLDGREDGRRCLSLDEMEAKGWRKNRHGRWVGQGRGEDWTLRSKISDAVVANLATRGVNQGKPSK